MTNVIISLQSDIGMTSRIKRILTSGKFAKALGISVPTIHRWCSVGKGSKGYPRLVTKIAKLHKRIADIRQNTLHQLTSYLATHFANITVEDLNVWGMMANGKYRIKLI